MGQLPTIKTPLWKLCTQVKAQNDFSDDTFKSKYHYAKDIVKRETVTGTTTGYSNYDFHETIDKTKVCRIHHYFQ